MTITIPTWALAFAAGFCAFPVFWLLLAGLVAMLDAAETKKPAVVKK